FYTRRQRRGKLKGAAFEIAAISSQQVCLVVSYPYVTWVPLGCRGEVVFSWENYAPSAPGKTGRGLWRKEPHDEGVGNRIGPESCVAVREGRAEALTGVRAGPPWSREYARQQHPPWIVT